MKLNPAPRFLHVIGVEVENRMVSGIHMADKPFQLMGSVVSNHSTALSLILPGNIVFFRADNANSIWLDEDGLNVIIFEDAVLCSCQEKDLKCTIRNATVTSNNIIKASPVMGMGNAPGRA
jgi:hypothetical protein